MAKPPLKNHQSGAISFALGSAYSIIGADPGTGKSRIAIEIREKLKNNCLIICPSYLVPNWVKEINIWTDNKATIVAFTAGKQIYEVYDADYVVISYDLSIKAEHLFEWADMVILDECQNIKAMSAKRTQAIHKNIYENSVPRVHLLTGTPIKNRVAEFYSLLALCFYNPHEPESEFLKLYPSEIDFADQFSYREEYTIEINNRYIPIIKWSGLKNVGELKHWLKGRYYRIKSDVLDLPPVVTVPVLISENPDVALLDAFNRHFERDGADSVNPTAKAEAALRKVPFTIKYAEGLLEEVECLLIYSDHREASFALAKHFGVKALNGTVPAFLRTELARKFQAGEGKVLVATIKALSEGVDLTRANHVIFNDLPWVPGDMKQVVHRIQRLGQKSRCYAHKIYGSPQDAHISEILDEKIKVIDRAT